MYGLCVFSDKSNLPSCFQVAYGTQTDTAVTVSLEIFLRKKVKIKEKFFKYSSVAISDFWPTKFW